MRKKSFSILLAIAMLLVLALAPVGAQPAGPDAAPARPLPGWLTPVVGEDGAPLTAPYVPAAERIASSGEYMLHLADATLADIWLAAQAEGEVVSQASMQAYHSTLLGRQDAVAAEVVALGGEVLASYQKVFNGLAVSVPAGKVRDLMGIPGVVHVEPIPLYEVMLDETVPWVGAATLQGMGFDGTGVRVAIIDTGIDYTHEHLGGSGLQEDTDRALAFASQPAPADLFPTAKVIGGYDFVGSVWPQGPLMPDTNPMDDQAGGTDGHGTHVGSIAAGVATAALGPGVAPGAELYALKVCSSVSTSCSGVAIQQALDWVADPNGDFFFDDRADVVNMSLGAVYGQKSDATDLASARLVGLGATVVASAGNSGDKPYITGSPSTTRAAISVAQSTVPSDAIILLRRNSPEPVQLIDAVHQPWTPLPEDEISGDIVYGNGDGSNLNGCATFTADLTGKVALVDRGACTFTSKVLNAEAAGAIMAIIAQNVADPPFAGGFGGEGFPNIPGFMISRAAGLLLKEAGANVTVNPNDPTLIIPLPDTMVGSSSRGPRFDLHYIKPDISAPGGSISASSGNQSYLGFGGTSGAAPMVAGAAALLLDAHGGSGSLAPHALKAMLMNNAMTDVWEDEPGGKLSPITRQGAGRMDVNAAYGADVIAWIPADHDASLSFGFQHVAYTYTDSKIVEVLNTGESEKTYSISTSYRYADDEDAGVVVATNTISLTVPAGGVATFDVTLTVDDPLALKDWPFLTGAQIIDGPRLTDIEVDGFVTLTPSGDGLHQNGNGQLNLPFQFLPFKAADVSVGDPVQGEEGVYEVTLTNSAVYSAAVEVYSLVDISPQFNVPPTLFDAIPADLQYVGLDVLPFSATQNLFLFAIGMYGSSSNPINVGHDIWIDIDQDGVDDWLVFNVDLSFFTGVLDGRNVSAVCNLHATPVACTAQFFVATTINYPNMVIPAVIADTDMAFNFQVFSFDAYFGGAAWDWSPANADEGAYHAYDGAHPAFVVDEVEFLVPGVEAGASAASDAVVSTIAALSHRSPSQIGVLYRILNNVRGGEMIGVTLEQGPILPATVDLPLVADTWVNGGIGEQNTNNNTFAALIARTTGLDNVFLTFDRSMLPEDVEIVKAELTVNVTGQSGAFGKSLTALNTGAFDSATVTYNNAPGTFNPSDPEAVPDTPGPVTLDVTAQIAAWDAMGQLAISASGPPGRVIMDSLESFAGSPATLRVWYIPNFNNEP